MYRGTTPTLIFKLDTELDLTTLTQVWVTIQNGDVQYTYDITRVTIDNEEKTLSVSLTQEETLAYKKVISLVQIRMLTSDNKALATKEVDFNIHNVLKGGVIE